MIFRYHGPNENPKGCLKLSESDRLWLCRAFLGEHGMKDPSVLELNVFLWCMVNRFLLHPGNKHWPSFQYMLRRFSQPVNPRWQRGGDLAERYAGTKACTEAKFRRREMICGLTWAEIPHEVLNGVNAFTYVPMDPGYEVLALPKPRVSNFASTTAARKRKYPWGIDIGGNWYFEDKLLRPGSVVVDHWIGRG